MYCLHDHEQLASKNIIYSSEPWFELRYHKMALSIFVPLANLKFQNKANTAKKLLVKYQYFLESNSARYLLFQMRALAILVLSPGAV